MLHIIFTLLRGWLDRLGEPACTPDPLAAMSPNELADLPAIHPLRDDAEASRC